MRKFHAVHAKRSLASPAVSERPALVMAGADLSADSLLLSFLSTSTLSLGSDNSGYISPVSSVSSYDPLDSPLSSVASFFRDSTFSVAEDEVERHSEPLALGAQSVPSDAPESVPALLRVAANVLLPVAAISALSPIAHSAKASSPIPLRVPVSMAETQALWAASFASEERAQLSGPEAVSSPGDSIISQFFKLLFNLLVKPFISNVTDPSNTLAPDSKPTEALKLGVTKYHGRETIKSSFYCHDSVASEVISLVDTTDLHYYAKAIACMG